MEAAARFGTQIPLEYAYAAWGALPGTCGGQSHPTRPYRREREIRRHKLYLLSSQDLKGSQKERINPSEFSNLLRNRSFFDVFGVSSLVLLMGFLLRSASAERENGKR